MSWFSSLLLNGDGLGGGAFGDLTLEVFIRGVSGAICSGRCVVVTEGVVVVFC